MNDLVVQDPQPQVPSLLNLIASTARDPTVDIAKFETLLRMQREIIADEAKLQFNRAMNKAQAEMVPVVRDAENTQTHSRYAKLETIDEAIRPIYTRHGFSLSFNAEPGPVISLSCDVSHEAGHTRRYSFPDCAPDTVGTKGQQNKTELHGLGSTVSYLRRYLTCMIFHVILRNEDDDGNAGGRRTQRQSSAPPPPPPRNPWLDSALLNLEQANGAWAWLQALLAAFASAPTVRDLDELVALPGVQATRAQAPADAREKIDTGYNKAVARLKGDAPVNKAPPQPNPKTEPSRQPATEFEAILIDASGEPQDALYSHPREFMEAFMVLWREARTPEERQALKDYNADGLEAARPDAEDILDQMVEQNVLPREVAVEPPVERGKISWPAYTKTIRHLLTTLHKRQFEEWTEAQRQTIEKAPLAQRVLVIRAIAETAGAMDITPPKWLGDLMRKPAKEIGEEEQTEAPAEPVTDTDERWVNARVAELAGITERVEFDQLIGSQAVRTVMARLRRDKPELFARAEAAFTQKHQALAQRPGDHT